MSKTCSLETIKIIYGGDVLATFKNCSNGKSYNIDVTQVINKRHINLSNINLEDFPYSVEDMTFEVQLSKITKTYKLDSASKDDFIYALSEYASERTIDIDYDNYDTEEEFWEDTFERF